MNVGEICRRPAITASASAPLSEIAVLMCQHRVGTILVTKAPLDRPVVAGILTDRDIVRAQLERAADLSSQSAEQAMTRDPLEINQQESLSGAIQRMRARGVRRAPVIDAHGALVGVVSTDDLIAQVAMELMGLATLLARQSAAT